MTAPDITRRLEILAKGNHLDLADLVCADAITEIKQLRGALEIIDKVIYALGAPLGSEAYFIIRQQCQTATHIQNNREK
jgi:hypothetical protein